MRRHRPVLGCLIACAALVGACQGPYHQRCSSDEDCGDLSCVRITGLEPFCSQGCSSSETCEDALGEGSYCGLSEVCFHACETDEDCPGGASCRPDALCAHRGEEAP